MSEFIFSIERLKKQAILFSVLALMVAAFGCGKNVDRTAQLDKFSADLENLTVEMMKKIDANRNLIGINEAQAVLDSRKDSIKQQFDEVKNLPTIIFPAEAKKRFDEKNNQTLELFQNTIFNHLTDFSKEPGTKEKLEKLVDDYTGMFEK